MAIAGHPFFVAAICPPFSFLALAKFIILFIKYIFIDLHFTFQE